MVQASKVKLKMDKPDDNTRYWVLETGKKMFDNYCLKVGYKNTFKNPKPIYKEEITRRGVFLSYDGGMWLDLNECIDLIFLGNYPQLLPMRDNPTMLTNAVTEVITGALTSALYM